MNKHTAEETISRGVEHSNKASFYMAMLVGEDGMRWLAYLPTDDFERATSNQNLQEVKLALREMGDGQVSRYFDAMLRQRRSLERGR